MTASYRYVNVGPAASLALLVLSSTAVTPASAAGGIPVLTKVVEPGDPAVDLGENLLIAGFGTHPDFETVFGPGDVPARIDRQGNITFHAFATENGLPGECSFVDPTMCPLQGLYRTPAGQLELIVAIGDDAPGTGLPFSGFASITPSTPHISNGRVAFFGLVGPIFNGDLGLWTDQSGAVELVALQGATNLPGMPADATVATPVAVEIHDDDTILFFSEMDTELLPSDFHPQGLWRMVGGVSEPIGVAGTPAPGFPAGVVFGDTANTNILGTFGTFNRNDAGRVAFTAFVRGPGIELRADEAVWVETDNGFEILLREDTPVPDGPFSNGSTFSSGNVAQGAFQNTASPPIRINNQDSVVFFAEIDEPGDPPRVPTLWSNRSGAIELVFRGRQRGVAFSVPGDEAPGIPGGNFFFPSHTEIDDNGHIAVRAFVETNNNVFDDTIGIWVNRGAGFEPVAFEEGPVPGMPGVTFIPEINGVRGVGDYTLERDGTIVYTGIFMLGPFFRQGVFRHPPDGPAEMVLRTGAQADIGGTGEDIRTVSSFRLGTGRSDDGRKPVEVNFLGGSTGIYTVNVASGRLGDLDGDGVVGITDFLMLLGEWGPCADCGSCSADLVGDCNVGITDLLALLSNWG